MRRSKVKSRGFWMNRWECARRYLRHRTYEEWSAETLSQGLKIEVDFAQYWRSGWRETVEFDWTEISRVVAYKTDEFAWDTMWLGFESEDGDSIAFPDDAPEWQQVAAELSEHLPGCRGLSSWYEQVMKPAFEMNYTVLYGGSNSEVQAS
jgi:hypothetical protein